MEKFLDFLCGFIDNYVYASRIISSLVANLIIFALIIPILPVNLIAHMLAVNSSKKD